MTTNIFISNNFLAYLILFVFDIESKCLVWRLRVPVIIVEFLRKESGTCFWLSGVSSQFHVLSLCVALNHDNHTFNMLLYFLISCWSTQKVQGECRHMIDDNFILLGESSQASQWVTHAWLKQANSSVKYSQMLLILKLVVFWKWISMGLWHFLVTWGGKLFSKLYTPLR